jgi:hypothetical protein
MLDPVVTYENWYEKSAAAKTFSPGIPPVAPATAPVTTRRPSGSMAASSV